MPVMASQGETLDEYLAIAVDGILFDTAPSQYRTVFGKSDAKGEIIRPLSQNHQMRPSMYGEFLCLQGLFRTQNAGDGERLRNCISILFYDSEQPLN